MFLLAGLSLGFLGSFHCVGMCGPIALAIPVQRTSRWSILYGSLIYNLGRMLTYASMGLLFGLLGQGFVLAGWQNILSISLGILILLLLFLPNLSFVKTNKGMAMLLIGKLKSRLGKLFGTHSTKALLLIGLLNGLLPCGLVYLGIAGSVATGNALKGALFMVAFGLGTLPAMLVLTMARDLITLRFREKIRKTIPVFVGMMALLLILRGMNLGIPYVSPAMETQGESCVHACCEK